MQNICNSKKKLLNYQKFNVSLWNASSKIEERNPVLYYWIVKTVFFDVGFGTLRDFKAEVLERHVKISMTIVFPLAIVAMPTYTVIDKGSSPKSF